LKVPKRLIPLYEEGLVDEVLSQLMSGKEATVYIVRCGDNIRCAKVYKDIKQRSFRQAASYLEGRKVQNSRQQRAMEKGSRYGREVQEKLWQTAEVDALFRLANAGVRVPTPYICTDGVLLMDLVTDADGNAAPRLDDVDFTQEQALALHKVLLDEVVRILCEGMVHGDLSEYNILLAADGPVIIDLPQAVNAAGNNEAPVMLERDVENLTTFFGRFAPQLIGTHYGKEIWKLYEAGELKVGMHLTGKVAADTREVDMDALMQELEETRLEQEEKLRRAAQAGQQR
jgi:RIO kinase 1